MRFLFALCIVVALVFACDRPLKRHPVPFYLGAAGLVTVFLVGTQAGTTGGLWPYFMPLMQRCTLAFVLFSVVMFTGTLDDASRLRAHLMPIRRQLSILACIFATGHVAFYATAYVLRIQASLTGNAGFSLALAFLLVALMAVLLATSFRAAKRRMSTAAWKRVQHLSYPFYLLTYVHLALLVSPSAFTGYHTAAISLAVYSVTVGGYVVLRTRRALLRGHMANCAPSQQTNAIPTPLRFPE